MPTLEKKRLLKLAGLLEANAENKRGMKFDLSTVGRQDYEAIEYGKSWEPALDCGTVGCAVGLACVSGAFERAGLGYRLIHGGGIWPTYDGLSGWGVEEYFFGLTSRESDYLFQSNYYPRSKQKGRKGELAVAARIREFVADRTIAQGARQY